MRAVLDRDLVVVTGKGGVGKSTVAAALARLAAADGRRVAVAELGARHDTSRLLEGSDVDVVELTPQEAAEEYLRDQLPSRSLADLLAANGSFTALVRATPGMAELLVVGKVWELTQDPRRTAEAEPYDLVVLDAPASGHGLAMLAAPSTFAAAVRVGPIHRHAERIDALLRERAQTAIVVVTLPEEMPVNEAVELRAGVRRRLGRDVDAVIANAILPDRFSSADAEALRAIDSPAARTALWAHGQARSQRNQLRRLRRGLDAPALRLPFVFADPVAAGEVAALGERLRRTLT